MSRTRRETPDPGSRRGGPASARSLLLTLVGEFLIQAPEPVWTASFLSVLAASGVADKAARQAIARAAKAGWITGERTGRRTAWQAGPEGRRLVTEGSRRVRSLLQDNPWDGRWLVLHVTLPDARRADRLRLYRALSWIGFGSPTPGIWVCPHVDRADETDRLVARMGLSQHTLAFAGTSLAFGMRQEQVVAAAWDVEAIAAHYAALVSRFSVSRPTSEIDRLSGYIDLVNALQRLPQIDPGLPPALRPAGLKLHDHGRRLATLREAWRDRAHGRWTELAKR